MSSRVVPLSRKRKKQPVSYSESSGLALGKVHLLRDNKNLRFRKVWARSNTGESVVCLFLFAAVFFLVKWGVDSYVAAVKAERLLSLENGDFEFKSIIDLE